MFYRLIGKITKFSGLLVAGVFSGCTPSSVSDRECYAYADNPPIVSVSEYRANWHCLSGKQIVINGYIGNNYDVQLKYVEFFSSTESKENFDSSNSIGLALSVTDFKKITSELHGKDYISLLVLSESPRSVTFLGK